MLRIRKVYRLRREVFKRIWILKCPTGLYALGIYELSSVPFVNTVYNLSATNRLNNNQHTEQYIKKKLAE